MCSFYWATLYLYFCENVAGKRSDEKDEDLKGQISKGVANYVSAYVLILRAFVKLFTARMLLAGWVTGRISGLEKSRSISSCKFPFGDWPSLEYSQKSGLKLKAIIIKDVKRLSINR